MPGTFLGTEDTAEKPQFPPNPSKSFPVFTEHALWSRKAYGKSKMSMQNARCVPESEVLRTKTKQGKRIGGECAWRLVEVFIRF